MNGRSRSGTYSSSPADVRTTDSGSPRRTSSSRPASWSWWSASTRATATATATAGRRSGGSVFRALKARAEEQERARLEREAEQQRLREERERQEAERRRLEAEREERERREWEAAVSAASIKAVHAARADHFGTALEQWRAAGEMRAFCAALDEAADASEDALEVERPREWSAWGEGRSRPARPHHERQGLGFSRLPRGADGRPTATASQRLASAPAGEGEASAAARATQAGARPMARSYRRTSGSRLEIWTPRSRSMVEAITPCLRSRRALTAFSTTTEPGDLGAQGNQLVVAVCLIFAAPRPDGP